MESMGLISALAKLTAGKAQAQLGSTLTSLGYEPSVILKVTKALVKEAQKIEQDKQLLGLQRKRGSIQGTEQGKERLVNDIDLCAHYANTTVQHSLRLVYLLLQELKKQYVDDRALEKTGFPPQEIRKLDEKLRFEMDRIRTMLREDFIQFRIQAGEASA